MSMDKQETNVLLIGQSGVGKSSLLNYLFGKKIQETGVGKPVTGKGVYKKVYEYDESFNINIYDTWGLEPDKSGEWEKLIIDEVRSHDKKSISEWFHTIIFCLNSNKARIEDFEISMIKRLHDEKNNIVIAITHCDIEKGEMLDKSMTKRILNETEVAKENIVYVNSIEQKLITGNTIAAFGRKEVFKQIIQTLWQTLKEKLFFRIYQDFDEKMEDIKNDIYQEIDMQKMSLLTLKKIKNNKYDNLERIINEKILWGLTTALSVVNSTFSYALDYYNKLSEKYVSISLFNLFDKQKEWNISYDIDNTFKYEAAETIRKIERSLEETKNLLLKKILDDPKKKKDIQEIIEMANKYLRTYSSIKKTLKSNLNQHINCVKMEIYNEITDLEKRVKNLQIEKIYIKQMNS